MSVIIGRRVTACVEPDTKHPVTLEPLVDDSKLFSVKYSNGRKEITIIVVGDTTRDIWDYYTAHGGDKFNTAWNHIEIEHGDGQPAELARPLVVVGGGVVHVDGTLYNTFDQFMKTDYQCIQNGANLSNATAYMSNGYTILTTSLAPALQESPKGRRPTLVTTEYPPNVHISHRRRKQPPNGNRRPANRELFPPLENN